MFDKDSHVNLLFILILLLVFAYQYLKIQSYYDNSKYQILKY